MGLEGVKISRWNIVFGPAFCIQDTRWKLKFKQKHRFILKIIIDSVFLVPLVLWAVLF